MTTLKERLTAVRHNGQFMPGGGTIGSDGSGTSWGGEKIMVAVNPDGAEALARIEALEAALLPLAILAEDPIVNMNDPLSKWFTIAQLVDARNTLEGGSDHAE